MPMQSITKTFVIISVAWTIAVITKQNVKKVTVE